MLHVFSRLRVRLGTSPPVSRLRLTSAVPPCLPSLSMSGVRRSRSRSQSTSTSTCPSSSIFCAAAVSDVQTPRSIATSVSPARLGETVRLSGWLHSIRRLGFLTFIVLRDASGVVQLQLSDETASAMDIDVDKLRPESVVSVVGAVALRPSDMINPDMDTGEVEVVVHNLSVLNASGTLPFQPGLSGVSEEVRLRHRYLDLRCESLQTNLRVRSAVTSSIRACLGSLSFLDVETPTLFRSTPEGAREFLVPTRQPNRFYALVQSPQQYKQLLMASGVERYYQFARCYRDEGGRADRQPEFTQVDIEMSFVDRPADVMVVGEAVLTAACAAAHSEGVTHITPPPQPFPRHSFAHVMARFGSDKPDRRYGLPVIDVTPALSGDGGGAGFAPFTEWLDGTHTDTDGGVRAVCAPGLGAKLSRKKLDALTEAVTVAAAAVSPSVGVLVFKTAEPDGVWKSPLGRHVSDSGRAAAVEALGGSSTGGDVIVMSAGSGVAPSVALGAARAVLRDACETVGLPLAPHPDDARDMVKPPTPTPPGVDVDDCDWRAYTDVLWVTDFPLFEAVPDADAVGGRAVQATHHPFTAPVPSDAAKLWAAESTDSLLEVRGQHYDLVVNGTEVGGGSVRLHEAAAQRHVLDTVLDLPPAVVDSFSHLLAALGHGTPPHGGIAVGFDRLVAILCNASSLRDVIAFPKSAAGNELMTGAPAAATPQSLVEYNIQVTNQQRDDGGGGGGGEAQ